MPILSVSPAQRALIENLEPLLGNALGFGVDDGTTKFVDEQAYYEGRLTTAAKTEMRDMFLSLIAAALSSEIFGGGGGGGSVSLINTGLGLTGGPITTAGTIELLLNGSGGLSNTLGVGNNELGIAAGGVTNSMLVNSSLTVTAGAGLITGGAVSLGGSVTLDVGAGTGILANANDVAIDQAFTPTWTGDHLWDGSYVTIKQAAADPNDIFIIRNSSNVQTAGCSGDGFLWGANLWSDDAIYGQHLNIANSTYNGGEIVVTKSTVGNSTTYDSIRLSQSTAASGGAPRKYSPAIGFYSNAWDGAVSRNSSWLIQSQPVNGGSITHKLSFWTSYAFSQNAAAAFTMEEIQAGAFSITIGGVRIQPGSPSTNYGLVYNGSTFVPIEVAVASNTFTMSNKTLTLPVIASGLTATGSGSNDFSGSTGSFLTSTGAVSLAGNTTVVSGKTFSIADMTLGSILFAGSSGLVSQDNANLFYDNTNNRLGMGTTTPGVVGGSTDITGSLAHLKSVTEHAGLIIETSITSGKDPFILMYSSAVDLDSAIFVDDSDGSKLKFAMGVVNTDAQRNTNTKMFLDQSGNLVLGSGGLTLSAGAVTLTAMTAGSVLFAGTSGVVSQNNAKLFFDTANSRLAIGANSSLGHSLTVVDATASTSQIKIRNTNASNGVSQIEFFSSADASKMAIGYNNLGTDAYIYGQASTDFSIQVNAGATKHLFRSAGQVGLGYVSAGSTAITQHRAVIFQDITYPSDVTSSQLAVCGTTDPTKIMAIGVDTNAANGFGFIAAGKQGTAWTFLALQPSGGGVGIGTGTTSPAATLELKDASAGNLCALAMNAGQSATTSAASTGKLRYNASTNAFQMSENTGAYQDVVLLSKTQSLTGKTLNGATLGTGAISVTGTMTFSAFPAPNYAGTSTNVVAPTWTAVSFSNSYADIGSPYSTTAYFKDGLGQVHLRIAATGGTDSTSMFTLPAGFRPAASKVFVGYIDGAYKHVVVANDGTVVPSGGNTGVVFGEVVFMAEA